MPMSPVKGLIDKLDESTDSVPHKLYKYSHIESDEKIRHARDVFETNTLYFPAPDGLNDPFDSAMKCIADGSKTICTRLFRDWLQRNPHLSRKKHLDFEKGFFRQPAWREVLAKGLEEEIMAKRQEFGVFCMTRQKADIVMWAHYAANHQGFCVEFTTDNSFFRRAREVHYEKQLAQVNVLSPWNALIECASQALLMKSEQWKYEEEWRIIDLHNGVGHQKCPPEAITGVILGCRMSMKARQQITDWCRRRRPQPKLYEARIKDGEFGLDIVQIPY